MVTICIICFNTIELCILPTAYLCVSYDSQGKQFSPLNSINRLVFVVRT
jgi:hypothetical protein